MDRQKLLIAIIVILLVAIFAMNSTGFSLQRALPSLTGPQPAPSATDFGPSDGGTVRTTGAPRRPQMSVPAGPVYRDGRVEYAAPAVGQVTVNGEGAGTVNTWMQGKCRPGSPEANRYPCVLQDANGNACQIGSCRDAEIRGLSR